MSKFTLQPEDGTIENGDTRGDASVDLQVSRSLSDQVASGYAAIIVGGENNKASGDYSGCVGFGNVADGTGSLAMGYSNTATGDYSFAAGFNAQSLGLGSAALGYEAVVQSIGGCILFCNGGLVSATGVYATLVGGTQAKGYTYGQRVMANGGFGGTVGSAQVSTVIQRTGVSMTSPVPAVLYSDGGTVLLLPDGNNRSWNITVDWVAVVTNPGATAMVIGDTAIGKNMVLARKVGGTVTIGTNTSIAAINSGVSMNGCSLSVTTAASAVILSFVPPTAANGTIIRVVATVTFTEVSW